MKWMALESHTNLDEPRRPVAGEKYLPPHLGPLPQGEEEPSGSVGAENGHGRFIGRNGCARRRNNECRVNTDQ